MLEDRRVLAAQIETGLALEHIYQNDPSAFPEMSWESTYVRGDLDGDDLADLIVFTYSELRHAVLFAGQGDGTYVATSLPHVYPISEWILGDIDGDGDQDLVTVFEYQLHVSLNAGQDQGVWQGMLPTTQQTIVPNTGITAMTGADVNGDRYLDLVLGTADAVYVKPGLGDGRFDDGIQYPLTNGSNALVAGDLDDDGDLDLVSAKTSEYGGTGPQSLDLLINDGEGIFEPLESRARFGRNINHLMLGDVDEDGDLDLVAAHEYSYGNNVSIALGDDTGQFADPAVLNVNGLPASASLGDIDGDGDLDLCVAHHGGPHGEAAGISVLLARGGGDFASGLAIAGQYPSAAFISQMDGVGAEELTIVTREPHVYVLRVVESDFLPPVAMRVAGQIEEGAIYAEGDWDGNGTVDVLVNAHSGLQLQLNPGTADAQEIPTDLHLAWHQVILQDFTADGRTDLLAVGAEGVQLTIQDEQGRPGRSVFTATERASVLEDRVFDLNRDGLLDLLLINGSDLSVWLGTNGGTFEPSPDSPIARGQNFKLADWDTDGDSDLLVLSGNRLSILLSDADGTFRETFHAPVALDTVASQVSDLDGDGDLDVILQEVSRQRWRFFQPGKGRVMINAGDGSLEELVQSNSHTLVEGANERLLVVDTPEGDLVVFYADSSQPRFSEVLRKVNTEGAFHLQTVEDVDHDGDLDFTVYGPQGTHLFIGSGRGNFAEIVVGNGYSFADWNADGLADLITIAGSTLRILIRNTDGQFDEAHRYRVTSNAYLLDTIDLDGDGDQDVILQDEYGTRLRILVQSEDDQLTEFAQPNSYALADLNRDGRDELLLSTSGNLTVYCQDGGGQLEKTSEITLSRGSNFRFENVSDLDGDGDLDVLMRSDGSNFTTILLGAGNSTLAVLANGYAYDFSDWNEDGAVDLFFADHSRLRLLLGDGRGDFRESFSTSASYQPWFESTRDIDGDGDRDLVMRRNNGVQILLNEGEGRFIELARAQGYHLADWNGDTRTDLLTWSSSEVVVRLANSLGEFHESFRMSLNGGNYYVQHVRDFDDDGDLDFLLRANSVAVMINAGDGTFHRNDLAIENLEVRDVCDLNTDGWMDLIGWHYSQGLTVFYGDETEPYTRTMALPVEIGNFGEFRLLPRAVDLDRDGYLDQVFAWETWGTPATHAMIFWGGFQRNPRPPIDLVLPPSGNVDYGGFISVTAQDIDQDGDPDLVLGGNRVIYNQVDRLRPWGDADGNGQLDVGDVDTLMAAIRAQDPRRPLFDLNRDDLLDGRDLTFLVEDRLGTTAGDADLNGRFDTADLVRVFEAGEYEDGIDGNSTWAEGDWDGDGDFTVADLVLALQTGAFEFGARGLDLPATIAPTIGGT